jgi:hypothetical protein
MVDSPLLLSGVLTTTLTKVSTHVQQASSQTKLDYNNFEIKKPITTTTTTVMTTLTKMRNK